MVHIKFIIGNAGTGKTYTTLKSIESMMRNDKSIKVSCLAFTHSAVNNMKSIISKFNENQLKFYTIHKFFQLPIPFKPIPTNHKVKDKMNVNLIVIDEFSLIPLDIMRYMIDCFESIIYNLEIIFIGDILQLPPIAPESDKIFNYSFFKSKKNKDKWEIIRQSPFCLEIGYYLSNTIYCDDVYQKSDKLILTHNYRSESNVMKILNDVFDEEYIPLTDSKFLYSPESKDYVIISSEYSILSDTLIKSNNYSINGYPTKIGKVKDNKCILNETIDSNFLNGDTVFITNIISDNEIEITNELNEKLTISSDKVLPYNYITVHKAQGRGYDNVVLILDSLFEITMLYTGITRARKNIKFIILKFNKNIENNLKKIIHQFKILKKIIYS